MVTPGDEALIKGPTEYIHILWEFDSAVNAPIIPHLLYGHSSNVYDC